MFTYLLRIIPLFSHLSPSLISLKVSVDAKHHVYLLTYLDIIPLFSHLCPSLISLMVSVDVKRRERSSPWRGCMLLIFNVGKLHLSQEAGYAVDIL